MANEVNIYTPRYLAEVVRQAPPVHPRRAGFEAAQLTDYI